MYSFKISGSIALAIAFGLAASFAQGSWITPDSIPNLRSAQDVVSIPLVSCDAEHGTVPRSAPRRG